MGSANNGKSWYGDYGVIYIKGLTVAIPYHKLYIFQVITFLITGRRAIEALRVKCSNADRKCEWKGTFGTLKEHVVACGFNHLPCPKGCKGEVMKKDMDEHLRVDCPFRDYKCQYCGEEGTFTAITGDHYLVCEKKIIFCSNRGCYQTMERCKVEQHVKLECEHTEIVCKYEEIGCKVKTKRRDMPSHEQISKQQHLDIAMDSSLRLRQTNQNLEAKLKASQEEMELLQLEKRTAMNNIKMLERKNEELTRSCCFVTAFNITNFQRKKTSNTCFVTQPFYTSEKGYNLAVHLYVNGDAAVTDSISAYVCVKKGRYDKALPWPFVDDVTLTLLNQLEDNNHFSHTIKYRATDDMRPGSIRGIHTFISHSQLTRRGNTQYLMNDSLFFRVYFKLPE